MTYIYIYIPARLDDHRFRISYNRSNTKKKEATQKKKYIPARLDDHRFRISYTEATQFIVVDVSRIFFRHQLLSFRLDQTAHQRRACMSAASKACQQLVKHVSSYVSS
jgi:isoleucyl-tRNA synthetase